MRHINGLIVEPYEDPDEDDWEDEEEIIEGQGFAYAEASDHIRTRAYTCPRCERKLFDADVSLHGVIFIRCRRCKRDVHVVTQPIMRKIGFIDPIPQRKENAKHDRRRKAR